MSILALAVVAAIIAVVLVLAIPRMRGRHHPSQRERGLRRGRPVAAERLEQTEVRAESPRPAEQHAALAEGEALRDRVEAHLRDGRSQRSAGQAITECELVARQIPERPDEPVPGAGRLRPAAWPVSHGVEMRLQEVAARLGTERVPAAPSPARPPRIHGGRRVRRGQRGQETASAGADLGDGRL